MPIEHATPGRNETSLRISFGRFVFDSILEGRHAAATLAHYSGLDARSIVRFVNRFAEDPSNCYAFDMAELRRLSHAIAEAQGGTIGGKPWKPGDPVQKPTPRLNAAKAEIHERIGREWRG